MFTPVERTCFFCLLLNFACKSALSVSMRVVLLYVAHGRSPCANAHSPIMYICIIAIFKIVCELTVISYLNSLIDVCCADLQFFVLLNKAMAFDFFSINPPEAYSVFEPGGFQFHSESLLILQLM